MTTKPVAMLVGTAMVKVHTGAHDFSEYRQCCVTIACPDDDGAITIKLQNLETSTFSGASEIRVFNLSVSRKVSMKCHQGRFIVVVVNGALIIKLGVLNLTEQLRWALALKPGWCGHWSYFFKNLTF